MPKRITRAELDTMLQRIAEFPEDASLEQIASGLKVSISLRTLQRRLRILIKAKEITAQRRGRTSYYQIAATQSTPVFYDTWEVPVSPPGLAIKRIIRQPPGLRIPAHYNRSFLDAYQPNVTYYLPAKMREKLHSIGKIHHHYSDKYGQKILQKLVLDLCWNSSRLEGNTYSLLETDRLLSSGEMAEGKNVFETNMILNHKKAIEFLADTVKDTGFSRYTIFTLHKLLANKLLRNSDDEGRLRVHPVGISGTVYYPLDIPQLIEECFQQIIDTAAAIQDPYEQSFFAMVHLPYLQPFIDVNKRVSRLAANIPFIRDDLCPLSFIDVPLRAYVDGILGVYELNRVELMRDFFLWAYDRSSLRYVQTRQIVGVCEPNLYRWRYSEAMEDIISHIVREKFNKKQAIDFIKQEATTRVPPYERLRFIETVETELLGLHEGNIAGYRFLRPHEYDAWLQIWK